MRTNIIEIETKRPHSTTANHDLHSRLVPGSRAGHRRQQKTFDTRVVDRNRRRKVENVNWKVSYQQTVKLRRPKYLKVLMKTCETATLRNSLTVRRSGRVGWDRVGVELDVGRTQIAEN